MEEGKREVEKKIEHLTEKQGKKIMKELMDKMNYIESISKNELTVSDELRYSNFLSIYMDISIKFVPDGMSVNEWMVN